jgi:hypothetical protein
VRWTRADAGQPAETVELTRDGGEWVVRHGGDEARFTSELLALIWRKCLIERAGWHAYEEDGELPVC